MAHVLLSYYYKINAFFSYKHIMNLWYIDYRSTLYKIPMKRLSYIYILLYILLIYLPLHVSTAHANAREEVILNHEVEVIGDAILLGDIFQYNGRYKNQKIANAPAPGQIVTLPNQWLYNIAKKYKLYWPSASAQDYVRVKRAGLHIDANTLKNYIENAYLDERLMSGVDNDDKKINVELNYVFKDGLWVDVDTIIDLNIIEASFNEQQQTYNVLFNIGTQGNKRLTKNVQGRIDFSYQLWVLKHNVARGTVIGAQDITAIWAPARQIYNNTITYKEDILDQQATRNLFAHKPLSRNDVQEPIIVQRKDLITVVFELTNMRLTLLAEALDSGSMGDVIRVKNPASKKVFQAVITGTGVASINNNYNNVS